MCRKYLESEGKKCNLLKMNTNISITKYMYSIDIRTVYVGYTTTV